MNDQEEDFRERISSWKVGRVIGKGGFSVVRIATAKDDENHQVAMKLIDLNLMGQPFASLEKIEDGFEQTILNEPQMLRMLDHPNIIQLEYAFIEDSHLVSCLEYIDGYDLSCYVTRYAPDIKEIQRLFYQLCLAVSYCHSQMVVHGDLKCENVLIRKHDQSVKVIDFGFSRQFKSKEEELQIMGQTIEYSPPQDRYLSFVWDSWSLGVILYVMITHCLPFTTLQLKEESKLNTAEIAKKATNKQVFEILMSLWEFDPHRRALIGDLMNESPWLKEMEPQKRRKKDPSSISTFSSQPFSCASFPCLSSRHSSRGIPFGSKTPPSSFAPQNVSISFPETSSIPKSFILFDSLPSENSTPLRKRRSLKITRGSTETRESIQAEPQELFRADPPESIRTDSREPTRNVQGQAFPSTSQKEEKKKKREKPRKKKGSIISRNKFF